MFQEDLLHLQGMVPESRETLKHVIYNKVGYETERLDLLKCRDEGLQLVYLLPRLEWPVRFYERAIGMGAWDTAMNRGKEVWRKTAM